MAVLISLEGFLKETNSKNWAVCFEIEKKGKNETKESYIENLETKIETKSVIKKLNLRKQRN